MHSWLLGPSLSHYLRVRPEDPPPVSEDDTDLQETKKLLKEHLLDSIFERALDDIQEPPPSPPAVAVRNTAIAEAARDVPAPTGYYIYAITHLNADLWLSERGVDPTYPIYRYPVGQAQALISKVSLDQFGEKVLQLNLNDRVWFREVVEKHNRVLAAVQSQGSIVPMRVCTICDSLDSLKAFLREHYDDFVLTLGIVEGRKEWTLRVFCNERKLRLLTEKASSRVRALQGQMAGKPAEEVALLREELEHVIAEETRAVCRACIRHSNGTLTAFADGTAIVPVRQEPGGAGQRLIFHSAYLINRAGTETFVQQVDQLRRSYESLGFEFGLEGPSAPAHFSQESGERKPLAHHPSVMLAS